MQPNCGQSDKSQKCRIVDDGNIVEKKQELWITCNRLNNKNEGKNS